MPKLVDEFSDVGLYPVNNYVHLADQPFEERGFPKYEFPEDCYGYPCPWNMDSRLELEKTDFDKDLHERYAGLAVFSNILLAGFILFWTGLKRTVSDLNIN